jgi:hypothetical protein
MGHAQTSVRIHHHHRASIGEKLTVVKLTSVICKRGQGTFFAAYDDEGLGPYGRS